MQNAEDVVLEELVLFGSGNAAGVVFGVDGFGFVAGRVSEIERAKISGFKLHRHAAALCLVVGERLADEGFIAGEIGGEAFDLLHLFVTGQHFFLKGNVDAHVGIAGGSLGVVEGEKEGIDEEDPVEALGV